MLHQMPLLTSGTYPFFDAEGPYCTSPLCRIGSVVSMFKKFQRKIYPV
jgi:hypothetical protein